MKCKGCGREFEPRRPWHRYCDDCYWGHGRGRRWGGHPRFVWLERPELVLLAMALGVVLLVVLRFCE